MSQLSGLYIFFCSWKSGSVHSQAHKPFPKSLFSLLLYSGHMPGHVARSLGACCSCVYGTALLFTHTCLAASYCPVLKKKDCPLFLKKEVAECFHQTAPCQYRTGQLGSKGRVRDRAVPSPAWLYPAAPSQKGRARMGMVTRGAQPSSVCPQLHAAGGNTTTAS